jgi:hypothetical protein
MDKDGEWTGMQGMTWKWSEMIKADGEWTGNNGKRSETVRNAGTGNRQEITELMGKWLWS